MSITVTFEMKQVLFFVIAFSSYRMTVRASVAIKEGEQIFASYTLPLEGSSV